MAGAAAEAATGDGVKRLFVIGHLIFVIREFVDWTYDDGQVEFGE